MLFVSLFWGMQHASLAPDISLGCQWPPVGVEAVSPQSIPLVGTCILQASGFIQTLAHHAFIAGDKVTAISNMVFTILLGFFFVTLQATEYLYSPFTIADSVYGTTFFLQTGLHGQHVIAGVLFQCVSLYRIITDQFTTEHNLGLLFSIWYWHFVDVVWLALYQIVYVWGGGD